MSDPKSSSRTADVVIIGGGVIGLTIARSLRLRGVRSVTLVERGQTGAEASSAAAGLIAPQVEANRPDEFFQLACQSRDMYPAFANALTEESGVDVELDVTGTLYLGFTQKEEEELRRRYHWQAEAGYAVEWLSGDEARSSEPNISANAHCALRFPHDIQVENRKLVAALAIACERLGVRLVTRCEVSALRIEQGRIRGLETSLGPISSNTVVVAAGAWTSLIEPTIASAHIRIEPVRGQMLCFKSRPQIARHVIYGSRGYLVPRRDGRLLAGSTVEQVGFDKSVTDPGVKAIKSMALELVPESGDLPIIDSWAGFRPRAPDDLPIIGVDDEVDGLLYATGHYRNGILLAPATGELIADVIVNGATPPLLIPFLPGRFRPTKSNP